MPVRVTRSRVDYIDRISSFLADSDFPKAVTVIVVDDGSPPEYLKLLRDQASDPRITVLSTARRSDQLFNIAHARNHGAQRAPGEFLLFLDADLIPYPDFFTDLLREVEIMGMHEQAQNFLMCPVIYLTNAGHAKLNSLPKDMRRQLFISAMLRNDGGSVEKYSCGTSAIVIRKDYFLARGGYDPRFAGWGYEDYEFANRLIRRAQQFPLPEDWMNMEGNFATVSEYKGWKSAYRLHGDWLAQKGIWLFHAPHEVEKSFHYNKRSNWKLLRSRMKADVEGDSEPQALPDLTAGRSLLLTKNPFCYERDIAPFFGEAIFARNKDFASESALATTISRKKIGQVVFGNPYKNTATTAAYNWCREHKFPVVVCERGALPDSVFHDRSGFLLDGDSYNPKKWDRPLLRREIEAVENYIQEIRSGSHLVEQQAGRTDLQKIRSRLGIGNRQKVLLVPFQQPNDSVVRHFAGPVGSFKKFHDLVCSLPAGLGNGWRVVYKKHPVEEELTPIPDAINGENFNIYDLIEVCDSMLVMNSGTGLYAMMFGKPVFIAGACWYADDRMNVPVSDIGATASAIRAGFAVDHDRVLRFIHYLRFEFYSFGEQVQRRVRHDDGSPITATREIKYYELRGFTPQTLYIRRKFEPIPKSSPLFDRYRSAPTKTRGIAAPAKFVSSAISATARRKARLAKIAKLRRSPYAFFRDWHTGVFRRLRHLFSST